MEFFLFFKQLRVTKYFLMFTLKVRSSKSENGIIAAKWQKIKTKSYYAFNFFQFLAKDISTNMI